MPTYFLFTLRGYFDHPEISGLSWNADNQLLLNGYLNNTGFGDLQLYNLDQNQGQDIAPNGTCCYRDVHWSPDGTYLFYTYQPESGGEISLHYAPVSQLDQPGSAMTSLALATWLHHQRYRITPTRPAYRPLIKICSEIILYQPVPFISCSSRAGMYCMYTAFR